MRSVYHEQLDQFDDGLVQMTTLVNAAMIKATNALLDADLALAESVNAGDDQIYALAHDLEDEVLARLQWGCPLRSS